MKPRASVRTIKSVLNKETGKEIIADTFFKKTEAEIWDYRIKLQEAIRSIRDPLFVCYICGQKIKINGGIGTNKILHFSHYKDSNDCPLKTDSFINKKDLLKAKYNGAKESPLHKETKNLIKKFLLLNKGNKGDVSYVETEKITKSKLDYLKWKKPDVTAIYKRLNLVLEIQLSTTFLSVIVDREHFYKKNETYIIWVFKNFELEKFKQRFTDKDIFYSNNRNAFVLDDEAIKLSEERKELVLLCHWQKPEINNEDIQFTWEKAYVTIGDLTFDSTNYKIYYYDFLGEELKVRDSIKDIKDKRKIELLKENVKNIRKENIESIVQLYSGDHNKERREFILKEEEEFGVTNIEFYDRLYKNYSKFSKLQRIFCSAKYDIEHKMLLYFNRFHQISSEEKNFLKNEFEEELKTSNSKDETAMIYYLTQAIFYAKFIDGHKDDFIPDYNLEDVIKYQKYLFTILSLKLGKVLGFKYANLSQIVNLYFNQKSKYYRYRAVAVFGIKFYYKGGLEEFYRIEDKKGGLRKKIDYYLNNHWQEGINNMKAEEELSKLITIIFPKISFHLYL